MKHSYNPGDDGHLADHGTLGQHVDQTTGAHGLPNPANLVVTGDARLNDARIPTAHKATHAIGGTDVLTPGDIGADAVGAAAAAVTAHTSSSPAHAGSAVSVNTSGLIVVQGSDTNVQLALARLDAAIANGMPPAGPAGGDLTGSYPNPNLGASKVLNAHVAATAAIDWTKTTLQADPAAGTAGARTLGLGPQQAAAGNDARFSTVGAQPGDTYWTKPKIVGRWYSIPFSHINWSGTTVITENAALAGAGAAETGTPGTTNLQLSAGQLVYYTPIVLPAGTLDRLFIDICVAGTAGNVLLGLYADGGWTPTGSPLAQGSIDRATVSASAAQASAVINLAITGGLYWFAVLDPTTTGMPSVRGQVGGIPIPALNSTGNGGIPSALANEGGFGYYYFPQTTLGTAGLSGTLFNNSVFPRPHVRYAA